jgi:hypothetical protein
MTEIKRVVKLEGKELEISTTLNPVREVEGERGEE